MDKTASFFFNPPLHAFFSPCLRLLGWAERNLFSAPKRHNIWAETPSRRICRTVEIRIPSRRSPLGELPEEILLHIMRDLDAPSLLCLRRTSRQFMRLFGDREFSCYHGSRKPGYWQLENIGAMESRKAIRTFRMLIGRDRLCHDCLAARAGPDSKLSKYEAWAEVPLHCANCDVDHPSCAFSKAQRGLPDSERICTAREGVAHICGRASLKWTDIERKALNEAAPSRHAAALYTCRTRDGLGEIRFAFYGATYRLALAKGVGWRHWITRIEWDWDLNDNLPWWERDWCSERDYTWLSAEMCSVRRAPLVPESFWYRQVDPASFGLTADHESFGVTWCWSRSCPNYWRCYELRRGRRVYIPCEEGCGRRSQV